jgi:hypothetical protein
VKHIPKYEMDLKTRRLGRLKVHYRFECKSPTLYEQLPVLSNNGYSTVIRRYMVKEFAQFTIVYA